MVRVAEGASMIDEDAFVHRLALVDDTVDLGPGTKVWQFASVIRGARLGRDCTVASGALLDGPVFGDRCIISQNVAMGPGFKVGHDVFIGPNVTVCNDAWPVTSKLGFDGQRLRDGFVTVLIEDGVGIGANAVILPGVVLGAGAMIAAGAVVDRNVPPYCLWSRDGAIRPVIAAGRIKRMREAVWKTEQRT